MTNRKTEMRLRGAAVLLALVSLGALVTMIASFDSSSPPVVAMLLFYAAAIAAPIVATLLVRHIGEGNGCGWAVLVFFLPVIGLPILALWRVRLRRAPATEQMRSRGDTSGLSAALRAGRPAYAASNAARALARAEGGQGVELLLAALGDEQGTVRAAAAGELGRHGAAGADQALGQRVTGRLVAALADPDWRVRGAAAGALGRIGSAEAQSPLIAAACDRYPAVRRAAAAALGAAGDGAALPALLEALADPVPAVRRQTAAAAGRLAARLDGEARRPAVAALLDRLDDTDAAVRQYAAEMLGLLRERQAVEPVVTCLADPDTRVRAGAALALGLLADTRTVDALAGRMRDADAEVRLCATQALALAGDEPAVPALVAAQQDADERVRRAASAALEQAAGRPAPVPRPRQLQPPAHAARPSAPDVAVSPAAAPARPAVPTAGTRTFHSEEWGFTLAYPAGWEIVWQDEPAGSWTIPIAVAGADSGDGRPCLIVNARRDEVLQGNAGLMVFAAGPGGEPARLPTTAAEFIAMNRASVRKAFPDLEFMSGEETRLAGLPAARLVYSYSGQKGRVTEESITLFGVGVTFQLICEVPSGQYARFQAELQRILDGFQLVSRVEAKVEPSPATAIAWIPREPEPGPAVAPSVSGVATPARPARAPVPDLAVASLVAGIGGWFLPVVGAAVAIVTGHLARKQIHDGRDLEGGRRLATAGIWLGYAQAAVTVLLVAIVAVVALVTGATKRAPEPVSVVQTVAPPAAQVDRDATATARVPEPVWVVQTAAPPSVPIDWDATATAGAAQIEATTQVMQATATAAIQQMAARSTAYARQAEMQAALGTALGWPVVMVDSFDSNANNWPLGAYDDAMAAITETLEGGAYQWDVLAHTPVHSSAPCTAPAVDDFYLAADIQQVSGPPVSAYGIEFRMQGVDRRLYFRLYQGQYFGLSRLDPGQWTALLGPTLSPAIRPGQMNRLAVLARGAHLALFINDQLVAEAVDDSLAGGAVALGIDLGQAGDRAVFRFDNFELRAPGAAQSMAAVAKHTPSPAPAPLLPTTLPQPTEPAAAAEPAPTQPPSLPRCADPRAAILFPVNGITLQGVVPFVGTAAVDNLAYYKIEYRPAGADTWQYLTRVDGQVVRDDVLIEFHCSTIPPGVYDFRLIVVDEGGNYPTPCEVRVTVQR